MKRTILLFATMACMTITSLLAQEAAVNKIIETGRSDNQVMNHLDILTNRFGGRPIGSDAYDNATEWVASKFKEWGLEVELQEAGTLPVGFNRGPWFGKLLGENGMELHFVTPSYTSGTKGLQRGHVLLEPLTQDEFDRIKGQLKGAWVLVNGKNTGWPINWSATADYDRAGVIAENNTIAQKNRYTTSFTHDITINGLWFTTLGGNYLWLACLQLNLCHARHTIKRYAPASSHLAYLF